MHNEEVLIEERPGTFVIRNFSRRASAFCLKTREPQGAALRLVQAAQEGSGLRKLAGNPRALLGISSGFFVKAAWEAVFCPVHGALGKLAAGAIAIGLGIVTVEKWEEISAVLEWALPAALVARAGWSAAKTIRAAGTIAALEPQQIKIEAAEKEASGGHVHSRHCSEGLFSWKSAFGRRKAITLHKPRKALAAN